MKRKSIFVICVMLLIASQALFSGGSKDEAGKADKEDVKEKVVVTSVAMAGNDVVNEQYKLAFEKTNKNSYLGFNWAPIEYAQLHDKIVLNEASRAGEFDMLFLITDWLAELIPAKFLVPLNDLLENNPIEGWSTDKSLSTVEKFEKIYPPGVARLQTIDGNIYGIPAHDGPMILFYRTDLFNDATEKANFKAEYGYELKVPETWKQYKDVADFFTRPDDNLWGTAFAGSDPQATPYDFVQLAHNNGGEYFDTAGNPTFNDKEWVESLEELGAMYKENSPPGAESIDMLGRADQFKEGIVAMYIDWMAWGGYFEIPDISKIVGNVGYALMPEGNDNRDSLDIYWVFAISASSPNPDEAWAVMKTFASIEGDKNVALETNGTQMTVRYTTLNDKEVNEKFTYYELMTEILDTGYTFGSPYHPANVSIYDELKIAVQKYLLEGSNAKAILDDANKRITEAMAEFN